MLRNFRRWIDRALVPKSQLFRAIDDLRDELMMARLDSEPNLTGQYQDSWGSTKLGIGTESDKAEMMALQNERRLSRGELDALYRNGLVQRIINLPIADATRGWITIQHPDPKVCKLLMDQLDQLGIFHKTFQAACYGRMFRQAAVFMDIDDGQPLDQPVALDQIRNIPVASVHDSQYMQPIAADWFSGSEALDPVIYRLGMKTVHRDRLMIFNGLDAGMNNRIACMGTGESVMDAIYRPFRNLDVDYNAASTLAKDFRIMVVKMLGLGNKTQTQNSKGDMASALARVKVMKGMVSLVNAWVMGDQDTLEWKSAPVTGYAEIVQLTKEFLCWVTGIPHTKLFNEGTGAGLNNGKGESEQNDWAAVIEDIREHILRPQLNKIIRYLCALNGIDELVTYEFPPMNPQTPKEKAETRKLNAEADLAWAKADLIRLNTGQVTREELRVSRFINNTGDNADKVQVKGEKPPDEIDIPSKPMPAGLTPFGGKSNRAPGASVPGADTPADPDLMQDMADLKPGTVIYVPRR